ncbi:MAG TPA: hypothetical protein VF627_11855 [Abditibacterium sp.]|jgi:hypothetical protein
MLTPENSPSSASSSDAPWDGAALAPIVPLGQVVATPQALAALIKADVSPDVFLARHQSGDWGDVGNEDQNANDQALIEGARLLSVYTLPPEGNSQDGEVKVWVITEWDRSVTTLLLPSEY